MKHQLKPQHQLLIKIGLVLTLAWIPFYSSWINLIGKWHASGDGYSHGWLILIVCIYLTFLESDLLQAAWLKRHKDLGCHKDLGWLKTKPVNLLLFTAMLGTSLAWAVAALADIQVIQYALLPIIGWIAVAAVFGIRVGKACLFAFGIFYFALPIWDLTLPFWQHLAIVATEALLAIIGLPASIEGIKVTIPNGAFLIADGCSGLRYLLVACSLALIYGKLNQLGTKKTLSLFFIAMLIALSFNWLRIILIIYIGYASDMQSPLVWDHNSFGWYLFAVALIPFFLLARMLTPKTPIEARVTSDNTQACPPSQQSSSHVVKGAILMMLISGPFIYHGTELIKAPAVSLNFKLPSQLDQWQLDYKQQHQQDENGLPLQRTSWMPHFHGADQIISHQYRTASSPTVPIENLLFRYNSQSQGKELIYYKNTWVGASQSLKLVNGKNQIITLPHTSKTLNFGSFTMVSNINQKQQVWFTYLQGNQVSPKKSQAKLAQVWNRLKGRSDGTLWVVTAPCAKDCSNANQQIHQFLTDAGEQISEQLFAR